MGVSGAEEQGMGVSSSGANEQVKGVSGADEQVMGYIKLRC